MPDVLCKCCVDNECECHGSNLTGVPFTVADAAAMSIIFDVAHRGAPVARLMDLDSEPIYGTARHLVTDPDRAGFARPGDDVRKLWLRVTTTRGFEAFWSIPDLIQAIQDELFFPDATEH